MKIFKRILLVLFIVAFVLSITLNVVLGLSTTNKLIFDSSNKESLRKIYYTASYKLQDSKEHSMIYEFNGYEGETSMRYKYDLSCSKNGDNSALEFKCTQIGTANSIDGTVSRTTYFPGDDSKYVDTGASQTKDDYANTNLSAFSTQMTSKAIVAIYTYTEKVLTDETITDPSSIIKASVKFDLRTFSLTKTITTTITESSNTIVCTMMFDGEDRLTSISLFAGENSTSNYSLKIKYENTQHTFPELSNYKKEGAGE